MMVFSIKPNSSNFFYHFSHASSICSHKSCIGLNLVLVFSRQVGTRPFQSLFPNSTPLARLFARKWFQFSSEVVSGYDGIRKTQIGLRIFWFLIWCNFKGVGFMSTSWKVSTFFSEGPLGRIYEKGSEIRPLAGATHIENLLYYFPNPWSVGSDLFSSPPNAISSKESFIAFRL